MKPSRAHSPFRVAASLAAAIALSSATERPAHAVLSSSEQAQVRQYVAAGQLAGAPRVRALVARPDLTTEETVAALSDAVRAVPFTTARAVFLRELLFGGASAPSRPLLAVAVTRGVLARADAVMERAPRLEADKGALDELTAIYAFLDAELGARGARHGLGKDAGTGIPLAAYDECSRALAQHIGRHPGVLRSSSSTASELVRVRAQAALALVDLTSESPTSRIEVAERLGLAGERRTFWIETGTLLIDDGRADAVAVERARRLLARLPALGADTSAVLFGDGAAALRSRGQVLGVRSSLEGSSASTRPFTDEVEPLEVDQATFALASELARVTVRRALAERPELRAVAEKDVREATGDASRLLGSPHLDAESALSAAVTLLVLDAPRTVDLALSRLLAERPESAAMLSDALGVLAAFGRRGGADGLSIPLGRAQGASTETTEATRVELEPAGMVTAFSLGGHRFELTRGASGVVTSGKRDGAPLTLLMLPMAHVPVSEGISWREAGVVFQRLSGRPRGGMGPGSRVRIVGSGSLDAIATPAPSDDVVVEGDVRLDGAGGGLVVRSAPTTAGFRGAGVFFLPSTGPTLVSLRIVDDAGHEREIAPAVQLLAAPLHHVRVVVRGTRFEAVVGGKRLHASLPTDLAHGDVALWARRGASFEITGLAMRRP